MRLAKGRLRGDQTALFFAFILVSPLIGVAIMLGVILRLV